MGLEVIAGLLYVPLSRGGKDFIAFLRKGQPRLVHWAGKPHKADSAQVGLEPRKSFKVWSETVTGRCRIWTDEQLETAGVLALVYGKVSIDVLWKSASWLYFVRSSSRFGDKKKMHCMSPNSRTYYCQTPATKVTWNGRNPQNTDTSSYSSHAVKSHN